jgi:serine/threonine protein kinase
MNTEPKVIGKGSYGCVHKPSLKCKTRKVNYKNKISKYMLKKHAKTEMNEYNIIEKADPQKYTYLGKPTQCIPDDNSNNVNAIANCNLGNNINNFSILVMNDGGENLEDFSIRFGKNPVTNENKNKIELFWIEAQRILYGLTLFLQKDIIHHDLKAQNIVYNEETNRINFIDFGFMRTKSKMMFDCKNSISKTAIKHWSFPPELYLMNDNSFKKVSNWAPETKRKFINNVINNMENEENISYRIFLSIAFGHLSRHERKNNQKIVMNDFQEFVDDMKPELYDDYLNKSLNTIDVYGTGIGLITVLVHTAKFINFELQNDLSELCTRMVSYYLPYRYEPTELLHEYENIISKHGLLEKHNKVYENHILKTVSTTKVAKEKKEKKEKLFDKLFDKLDKIDFTLGKEDKEFLNLPPELNCGNKKDYNPITKKCVNKCKDDKIRNEKFRCVKNKTVKKG